MLFPKPATVLALVYLATRTSAMALVEPASADSAITHNLEKRAPPSIYRPDIFNICQQRGYQGASVQHRRCITASTFLFTCYRNDRGRAVHNTEGASCISTHMCLETMQDTDNIAYPSYTGLRGIVCMQIGEIEGVGVASGDFGAATPTTTNATRFPGGRMIGQMELHGRIKGMDCNLQWIQVGGGTAGSLGQLELEGRATNGLDHTYNIQANYDGTPEFYGVVAHLRTPHQYLTIRIFTSFFKRGPVFPPAGELHRGDYPPVKVSDPDAGTEQED